MLFNSLEFLVFFLIVFCLYWFVSKSLKWQNTLLLIASYIFYGWWDWRFLLLIALTSFSSYASGLLIAKYDGKRNRQKIISTLNIVLNLSILVTFKYLNFFAENFAYLFHCFGYQLDWVTLDLILPVGISFYTFQALSYSIDVYQNKLPACKDIIAFLVYISFFPQLLAGPIERATHLLPQFYKSRTFTYKKAVDGCRQILWGFFKKIVIADNCATIVNAIWSNYQNETGFTLLLGGFFFIFQIYGDFSGYSDIAIGTAKLLGVNLMKNFDLPFFSRDFAEVTRRWNISLNTWFRDYIYKPLVGKQFSLTKVLCVTFFVFLISGLWHGANWTFVVCGAFYAIFFIFSVLNRKNRRHKNILAEHPFLSSLKKTGQIIGTFIVSMLGSIIFRSKDITQAWNYFSIIFSKSIFEINLSAIHNKKTIIFIIILIITEWLQRRKQYTLQFDSVNAKPKKILVWFVYYCLLFFIYFFGGKSQIFIYFQF